jgi:protein TonB
MFSLSPFMPAKPLLSRHLTIALSVVLLHVGLIWALQSGLLIRAAEILIPAEVLSELIDPPAPIQPKKPPLPAPQPPIKSPEPIKKTSPPVPAPVQPLAVAPATVQATAATAPALAAPVAPSKSAAPVQAPPAPPTPAAAAVVQQPSSNADYLQNPKPPYPSLSARLGETGKTVYKVWIDIDGKPQRAELVSSSGFQRLDKAAYDTVMSWRYVPGKRNGVPEAMAFNVPIHWELRN